MQKIDTDKKKNKKSSKVYLPIDEVINDDALKILPKIASESVSMVYADPPYNLQLQKALKRPEGNIFNGVNDAWDKFDNLLTYDEFTLAWLSEIKRIMKKDATIWIMGTYHNIYRIGKILQDLDFWILNDIIWNKTNATPNFMGSRFKNSHEHIIWAAKSKDSKYCFHYHSLKAGNEDIQDDSIWAGPICSGKERIKDKKNKTLHPTQKPIYLLQKIIRSSTNMGDLILDPFSGSGTCASVSKYLRRHFIAIEKEKKYALATRKRLQEQKILAKEYLEIYQPKMKVKIPFASLIDQNILSAGEKLYAKDRNINAEIMADGTLKIKHENEYINGSIHKVGSLLKGRNVNGWQFWHFKKNGKLISIDELREFEK